MKKILVVLFTIFCSTSIVAQILEDRGKRFDCNTRYDYFAIEFT